MRPGVRPLWELAVLVVLLFGAYRVGRPEPSTRVRVSAADAADVAAFQEQIQGRSLAPDEARQAVLDYVDEEILVREAIRRGVDRGDPRVRQALRETVWMDLAGEQGVEPPEPTDAQLEAFFQEDPSRYRRAPMVAVDVISFPAGAMPVGNGPAVLDALRDGADPSRVAGGVGVVTPAPAVTLVQFSRTYGRVAGAAAFQAPARVWQGPLSTAQGTDFLRITGRTETDAPAFEQVRRLVEYDWVQRRYEEAVQEALVPIRRRYRVRVAPDAAR